MRCCNDWGEGEKIWRFSPVCERCLKKAPEIIACKFCLICRFCYMNLKYSLAVDTLSLDFLMNFTESNPLLVIILWLRLCPFNKFFAQPSLSFLEFTLRLFQELKVDNSVVILVWRWSIATPPSPQHYPYIPFLLYDGHQNRIGHNTHVLFLPLAQGWFSRYEGLPAFPCCRIETKFQFQNHPWRWNSCNQVWWSQTSALFIKKSAR